MAGGRAALIHQIFQRTGLPPDEFWAKPPGARAFMLASMVVALEAEREAREGGELSGG